MRAFLAFAALLAFAEASYHPYLDKCKSVSWTEGQCATLFDSEGCQGWSYSVGEGYSELPFRKKNEAKSVVVKAGCIFTGC